MSDSESDCTIPQINPSSTSDSSTMSIKVKDRDNNEVLFKVKPTTKFSKMFDAFCSKMKINVDDVRFLFDGARLRGEQCPNDVAMEDEDEVDCFAFMTGGSFFR